LLRVGGLALGLRRERRPPQHLIELGEGVGRLGFHGCLQLEARCRQLLQLGAIGLRGRIDRAERVELGQQVVGLHIERGHALVLEDLVSLLLEARVRPPPGLLELAHLGAQPRRVVRVELAQRRPRPVDSQGEILPGAGGGGASRTFRQLSQHQHGKEHEPAHRNESGHSAAHQRCHLWQNVADGQFSGLKSRGLSSAQPPRPKSP
jgi:hypothetical protein